MRCKYGVMVDFVLYITSHLEDVLTFFRKLYRHFFFPEIVTLKKKPYTVLNPDKYYRDVTRSSALFVL